MSFDPSRRRWIGSLGPLLLFTLLGVAVTWPTAVDPRHSILLGPFGDAASTPAFFDAWVRTIRAGHPGFDNLAGYPFGENLAHYARPPLYFGSMLLLSWLVGGLAAYNLAIVASYPLTGILARTLFKKMGADPLPATVGAVAFAFSAYHAGHALGHAALSHTEFLVIVPLSLIHWNQDPNWRRTLLAAAALSACILWDPYYAVFGFSTAVMLLVILHVGGGPGRALTAARAGVALAIAAIVGIAGWGVLNRGIPFNSVLAGRTSSEIFFYSGRPCLWLRPWYANPQLGSLGCRVTGLSIQEHALYLGLLTLLLAGIGGVALWRRQLRHQLWVPLTLLMGGLVLASPAFWRHLGLGPVLEWAAAHAAAIRVYSRATVVAQLGLSALVALGLTAARLGWNPGRRGLAAAVLATLLIIDSHGVGITAPKVVVPEVYRQLGDLGRGPYIEYPSVGGDQSAGGAALFWHRYNSLPAVGQGLAHTPADDLRIELGQFDSATPGRLAAAGVRNVVWRDSPPPVTDGLRVLWRGGPDSLLEVTAVPVALAWWSGDFWQPEPQPGGGYGRWLASGGRLLVLNPGPPAQALVEFTARCPIPACQQTLRIRDAHGPVVVTSSYRGDRVQLRLRLGHGISSTEVWPDSAPISPGPGDGRLVTMFLTRPEVSTG